MASEDEHRFRLVVLGAGHVGKSSVVSRLLSGIFVDVYRPTVEELHCRDFTVNDAIVRVDILDTAGNLEFPAMRRLYISTAHAYLLVYSVDDRGSFEVVKELWAQIRELRPNFLDLPCVVVANKCDLVASQLIAMEAAEEWLHEQSESGKRLPLVEVSAKNNDNLRAIYRKLLEQVTTADGESSPLLKRHLSANSARSQRKRDEQSAGGLSRSRSLIRRVRRLRIKERVDPNSNGGDCTVS